MNNSTGAAGEGGIVTPLLDGSGVQQNSEPLETVNASPLTGHTEAPSTAPVEETKAEGYEIDWIYKNQKLVICSQCRAKVRSDPDSKAVHTGSCSGQTQKKDRSHAMPQADISQQHDKAGSAAKTPEIPGLEYYPDFLSAADQLELLRIIDSNPWKSFIAKRQQFYGDIYFHTSFKHKEAQPEGDDLVGLDMQFMTTLKEKCENFFGSDGWPSQVLVNEYRNNMGIASHFEDFDAFGDIILTISLNNPLYMTLKKPVERTNECSDYLDVQKVLLEPGSLLVMKDVARNEYRHGIGASKWVDWKGQRIKRDDSYRRVSLTVRHLLTTRRKVAVSEDETDTIKAPERYGQRNDEQTVQNTE